MMRRASIVASTAALAVSLATLLPGCGLLGNESAPGKVELSGLLGVTVGGANVSPWALLDRGICAGSIPCAVEVPSDFGGDPDALRIAPAGDASGSFCDKAPSTAFLGKTCQTDYANEVGFSLCIPGANGGFGPGPCAVEAAEWSAEYYLEALMTFGSAVGVRALQAAASTPASSTSPTGNVVAAGSWPEGPAKVCVAMTPRRGVDTFGFVVTTMGGVASIRTQAPAGETSSTENNPICVAFDVQRGSATSVVVRVSANVMRNPGEWNSVVCTYTYASPDAKAIRQCTGGEPLPSTLIVGSPAVVEPALGRVKTQLAALVGTPTA